MNCIICNGPASEKFALREFTLLQCSQCLHQWIHEKDSVCLKDFYDADYFEGKKASFGASFQEWSPHEKLPRNRVTFDILNIFSKRDLSGLSILEIGPGPSDNLFHYCSSFMSVECFDLSPLVTDFLSKRGATVYNNWESIPDNKYDAVVAYEVIEHDPDPYDFCRKIISKLSANGVFMLTTGNTRSLYSRIRGKNWYYYDPPAHLNYFSDHSIQILLQKTGFEKTRIMKTGSTSKEILSKSRIAFLLLPFFLLISSSMSVCSFKASR